MAGASGAHVWIDHGVARKCGPEGPVRTRLSAQYTWLITHQHLPVVTTYEWDRDGYCMEVLYDPVVVKGKQLLDLASEVWRWPAEVKLKSMYSYRQYVAHKCNTLPKDLRETVFDTITKVNHSNLMTCLTHGDLTRANVMMRDTGELVLIDPIPAMHTFPDWWVCDVSKMFVSLLGYDGTPDINPMIELIDGCDSDELLALKYMIPLQIARMIPYHTEDRADELLSIAYSARHL